MGVGHTGVRRKTSHPAHVRALCALKLRPMRTCVGAARYMKSTISACRGEGGA